MERAALPPTVTESFYRSPEWRSLLKTLFSQRGRRCARCGTTTGRMVGDHIKELRDGGPSLDPDNIQLLCMGCHNAKTAKARAKRMKARHVASHENFT